MTSIIVFQKIKEKEIPLSAFGEGADLHPLEFKSPWHPESEKPDLPFVICTNGEGHYWMGYYNSEYGYKHWLSKVHSGGIYSDPPLAWIEPEKFVPFVKKDSRIGKRYNILPDGHAEEDENGTHVLVSIQQEGSRHQWQFPNKKLHKCENYEYECLEMDSGILIYTHKPSNTDHIVKFCPFCAFKSGEK